MLRYAAIDIGSNAVRLLIADVIQQEKKVSFKKNTLVRVPLRLGDDVFNKQVVCSGKIDDLVKTMIAFRNLMEVYRVSDYMACATSAMREAKNGKDIVSRISREASIDLEIIQGQREANIIYSSHIERSLERKKNYLYIDVGGGSTELSIFSNGELIASGSFNLGGIRMLDNRSKAESWAELKTWVKDKMKGYRNVSGIGTGGNINKLYRLADCKDSAPLSLAKLISLYDYLNSFSLNDRINVLGLNADRADVIIPAAEIYLSVMKWGDVKEIYVPRVGLVDGMVQILIDKHVAARVR